MKWLSFIMGFYVLVLSAFPCCQDSREGDKTGISIITQTDVGNCLDTTTGEDFCSPFVRCNCCSGFTLLSLTQAIISCNSLDQAYIFFNSTKAFNISLPIWQPPKLG